MRIVAATLVLLAAAPLAAQFGKDPHKQAGYDRAHRATVLHVANVYVSADSTAPPITQVTPGHEIVLQAKNGAWLNIFANTDEKEDGDPDSKPEFQDPDQNPDPSSGWIRDKGVVGPGTPHGDVLIFGAAAELEAQAAQPHPPKGAAEAAHLLYARVGDYFPNSPLAAEAAYRAADVRWQLEKLDISTLPSAHEMQPELRPQIYEGALRKVMKMYPGTPQEAEAAFDLLDNKLCGDWQGLPKCPDIETDIYMQYADRYPTSPKAPEAMYDAVYRQGALVTMFMVDDNGKMADEAKKNCQAIADRMMKQYPQSDYTARAESIAFRVAQGIPVFGSDRD